MGGPYVALSRVRLKEDIRLLLLWGSDRSKMPYIAHLEKNSFIKSYFRGYRFLDVYKGKGKENEGQVMLPMRWDDRKAAIDAGFINE